MKQWTMPSVEIEGFSANEYVAACAHLSTSKGYYYYDYDGNGKYPGVGWEQLWFSQGVLQNGSTSIPNGVLPTGWYKEVTLYTWNKWKPNANGSNQIPYSDTDTFKMLSGTYDIYSFGNGHVFVYKHVDGMTYPDNPTPDNTANHS